MANMVAFYRQSVCDLYTGLTCPQAVIFIFHCHLECVMDANSVCCAAHAAAGHLLLSIASKVEQKRILLVKTESTNQRKVDFQPNARRRQLKGFILPPSNSKRFTTIEFFSLAVGSTMYAFPNSRRQFGGFILSPSKCKRFTANHIFSLAYVCDCQGVSLCSSLVL